MLRIQVFYENNFYTQGKIVESNVISASINARYHFEYNEKGNLNETDVYRTADDQEPYLHYVYEFNDAGKAIKETYYSYGKERYNIVKKCDELNRIIEMNYSNLPQYFTYQYTNDNFVPKPRFIRNIMIMESLKL